VTDRRTDELRRSIAEQDRAILAAVNARLRLVGEVRAHKARAGVEFVDPEQEERLLQALVDDNAGPLSPAGVRALFEAILALTKREVS
jgi:3-deoxy-7-phosphoheptulonate synthase/chorismate mutase